MHFHTYLHSATCSTLLIGLLKIAQAPAPKNILRTNVDATYVLLLGAKVNNYKGSVSNVYTELGGEELQIDR